MYAVSPKQIKAARSLLDWTQDDLARESGVSASTVLKLERGEGISREGLAKICRKLEEMRIEFLGDKGIMHHHQQSPRTIDGPNSADDFYECLLATAEKRGGEITAVYPTAEIMARSLGIVNFDNLERIEYLGKYAAIKCLLTNAKSSSLILPNVQFRAISQMPFGFWPTLICGDKSVILLTRDGRDFTYMVVESFETATSESMRFALCWDGGIPIGAKEPQFRSRRS